MNLYSIKKKISDILFVQIFKRNHPRIHKSAVIKNPQNICIGENCRIGEGSYLLCWDEYNYDGKTQKVTGNIKIGDRFSATRNLTIQCCNKINIGDDVLIASNVFICDYNHGMNPNSKNYLFNPLELYETVIDDGVWIGQGAFILPGVKIGAHSIIGAGSVVTKNIPPYSIATGNPARVIKEYDPSLKEWKTAKNN